MLHGGVFAANGADRAVQREASLRSIDHSFLLIATLIALLFVFIALSRRRLTGPESTGGSSSPTIARVLGSRWALLGGLAIFLYVGAEVSIGSIMINFLHQGSVLGVSLERAGQLLSLYWLGAMVGRFAGSALMAWVPAARLTMVAAATAAVLCTVVIAGEGLPVAIAALAIGLFNSILFPTIFTLTLERSTAGAAATSGFLCMSIVGGAVLPPIVGFTADRVGLAPAFVVPAVAYAVIAIFAFFARRAPLAGSTAAGAQPVH
jgi:FHS family L-fucose permease-like MFS transporter